MDEYQEWNKKFAGILIVMISVHLLYKSHNNQILTLIFGIILYINLSLVLSDGFTNGKMSLPDYTLIWQKYRETSYENKFFNALFLFLATIDIFIINDTQLPEKCDKVNLKSEDYLSSVSILKENALIYIISLGILLFGLIGGYSGFSGTGKYESSTSTLYEYCILFFIMAWFYAGKNKLPHIILWIYAIMYIFQAIIYGDRSSAFPMIFVLFILYFKHISMSKLLVLAIAGITASNFIAVYRDGYNTSNLFEKYLTSYGTSRLTSDTVSQSYYTGVSLFAVKDMLPQTANFFIDFLIGIILGGSYGYSNVTALGKLYATNKGGGFVISDFYFWFGFCGVIILGIIISKLINWLTTTKFEIGLPWKIYFASTVFRWYLYTSFDLFRGVLFVFPVVYLFFYCIDDLMQRGKRK